jgi:metallophosphoesterase (TIGR00282 family)
MKILFIGDMMGNPGLLVVNKTLTAFASQNRNYDFISANVENAEGGFGLKKDTLIQLNRMNLDCMTSGNHIWDRPEIYKYINEEPKLIRPANYPPGNPGFGWQIFETDSKIKVAVINLQGRVYMQNIDCPFQKADEILEQIGDECQVILVDFHADASSEKQAMAWHLNGRVSAVVGTHTHVQTADERILSGGTGMITDVGMCGPYDSVIGMDIDAALFRLIKARPNRLTIAEGNIKFAAVEIDIDETTGKCRDINRLLLDMPED